MLVLVVLMVGNDTVVPNCERGKAQRNIYSTYGDMCLLTLAENDPFKTARQHSPHQSLHPRLAGY